MIALRRFGPLIVLVLGALGLVLARMAKVQLGEHAIWAREAANLVRSSQTLPYHRGRILDRKGRVIVQDDDAYVVELRYRDFRRGHPLGQVAHARAALEMRAVSLHLAAREIADWGLELVSLRPDALQSFARGGALELRSLELPPVADARADQRSIRAGEVRFYLRLLLGASEREWSQLRKQVEAGDGGRSYLELLAALRGRPASELARERVDAWRASLGRLEQLAWLLSLSGDDGVPPFSSADALARLLEALQRTRDGVEDAIASELFRLATGFPAARVRPELLLRRIDLTWLAASMRWSEARTELWATGQRESLRANWAALFVEGATIRALMGAGGAVSDRLLDEYAALFEAPPRSRREARARVASWRATDRLLVFDELETLFEEAPPAARPRAPILPFQEPALRAARGDRDQRWALFAALALDPGGAALAFGSARADDWNPPIDAEELAARFRRFADSDKAHEAQARADRRHLPAWYVAGWVQRFEERLDQALASMPAGDGPLRLRADRRERALEQYAYVVRDRGGRPVELESRPSYQVVQLLTRYPEDFEGLAVRRTTRRRAVAHDEQQRPLVPELIGVVRASSLREWIEQRELGRRLAELRRKTVRDERDREEMRELVGQLYRNDEVHGSSGIEGLFDELLRGENGYRENEGLEERAGRRREAFFEPPVDGRDLVLALDLDLQGAARRTLERPVLPPGETLRDSDWFQEPVGAIVLITPDGQVLAAASVPRAPGRAQPGRDGQREEVLERTLRMHTFSPVGSVFKPFVAAWALEHGGLDPREALSCGPLPTRRGMGYGSVRCHSRFGHGLIALGPALHSSCNAYFAQLGERMGTKEHIAEMARAFGFDEATGLGRTGLGVGLVEDWRMPAFREPGGFSPAKLQQAANGLVVVEATPMQVARAFAALATGRLPELRFDLSGSERPIVSGRPVPVSSASLELVRRALVEVVRIGSAAGKRLSVAELGFQLAAKTGSADYLPMNDELRHSLGAGDGFPDMRKHTWLAGWFPAEKPVAVVVVYCHDVAFTSSHTAVHVASQFLRTPEVQAYVAEARR